MRFNDKYKPLFRELPGIRYILVKGGRASGKSTAVSTAQCCATYNDGYDILYTRYTMTAAGISIIPEFRDKLEQLGVADNFRVRQDDIVNASTGAKILFRGLMTSSGNQVAKLKSIPRLKTWVFDEAQELDDSDMFDTVDFSVRQQGVANTILLSFNPTDIHSWIYERWYKRVPEGFNGIVDDTCYISTTYLDNREHLAASMLMQADKMRTLAPDKYRNIWLGEWSTLSEGIIYKSWRKVAMTDVPKHLPWFYGVDWGYANDPTAVVRCCYDIDTKTIYLVEVCYQRGLLAGHIARVIRDDMMLNGVSADVEIYCDPARPEHIGELRMDDLCALPGDNKNKTGRISYLQYFGVRYVGDNIERECTHYSWRKDPKNAAHYLNEPMDGNDHLMDAANYACVTYLRRLGETNRIGEQ